MTVLDLHINPVTNQVVFLPREIEVRDKMLLVADTRMRFNVRSLEKYQESVEMHKDIGVELRTIKMEGTPYLLNICSTFLVEDDSNLYLDGPATIMKDDINDPLLTEAEMEDARREFVKRLEVKEFIPGSNSFYVMYRIPKEESDNE